MAPRNAYIDNMRVLYSEIVKFEVTSRTVRSGRLTADKSHETEYSHFKTHRLAILHHIYLTRHCKCWVDV